MAELDAVVTDPTGPPGGLYDNSLIIVSSDHGTDLDPRGFNGESDSLSLVPGPSTSRLPATVGSAKAIMFIKRPGATGPIVISQAPTAATSRWAGPGSPTRTTAGAR